ncbi:MAG: hypothetical protein ABUK13_04250 [Gammaproteobacteria bacterium]
MQDNDKKKRDPVCEMWVDSEDCVFDYLGIRYAFCSLQCRERFIANPHLYIGTPGKQAPKQHGTEIIKQRVLKLNEQLTDEQADMLCTEIAKMMGIKNIAIKEDRINITYDLMQATVEQVERNIVQAGETLGAGWGEKMKRAFIHYLEETELDNLEQQPSSHEHGCH